jgi:hypothetical protein
LGSNSITIKITDKMSQCLDTKPVLVCFTNTTTGVKTTLIEHIVYQKGIAIGHAYTDENTETIFDTTGGTVTVGACPIIPPNVNFVTMCDDTLANGTVLVEFVAQVITSFDGNGAPIAPSVVNYLEEDLVTTYVPVATGTVSTGECGCAKKAVLGTITNWSSLG